MRPELVDRIYESAFVPECWPRVLEDLADIAGARAGFLFVSRDEIHNWTSSTQVGLEALGPLVKSGWVARSQRFNRFTNRRHSGFLTDSDLFEPEELGSDPFYRDVLYPRGLGWAAGTCVQLPTGDVFTVSLEREFARGPVEGDRVAALDALRPHIARGAMMSTRLQLERAGTISETLGAIGLAAAVLDDHGTVLATNPALEALTNHLHWRAFGRMALTDKTADRLLSDAIEQLDANAPGQVRSFPARGEADAPSLVVHVVPIRLSARDVFIRSAAIVVLTPISLPDAAPVELVQSLFDLTPAEARVARGLARGKTVDDIAADGEVTVHTVRAQVRGVLEKTGCTRQVEIVAMLTAISASMRAADTQRT
jgi:DNA-binding CsgD family transcriptional regulator